MGRAGLIGLGAALAQLPALLDAKGLLQAAFAQSQDVVQDTLSGLIAAQEGNDSLTTGEMIGVLTLLLVAGNVTTTDLIGNG